MAHMGDMRDLAENDVALKFWLPEPVEQAIREVACRDGNDLTKSLRQFLLIHCYGLYAYEWLQQEGLKDVGGAKFSRRQPSGKVRIATYWVAELGKNTKPIKLWVPTRLKQDLGYLAEHAGLTLSNYVREITIARFLGHGTLPMRSKMLEAEPSTDLEVWCNDQEPKWRQVDFDEFNRHEFRETRFEWADDQEIGRT